MQKRLAWMALDLAATAAECHNVDEVRVNLLPSLAHAVGAEIAIYHQVGLDGDLQEYGVAWPANLDLETALTNYPVVARHSPLVRHFATPGASEVVSLGQLVSPRQWHNSPLYRECHRQLGIEDHLALAVHLADGRMHALTFGRDHGTFTQTSRDLLTLLAPHIRAAIRRSLMAPTPYRVLRTFPNPAWTWQTGPAITASPQAPLLTPRELEVLSLATGGYTSHQVSRRLGLATRTVDKHLEHAFRKLGANSRSDAAAKWREQSSRIGQPAKPSAPREN